MRNSFLNVFFSTQPWGSALQWTLALATVTTISMADSGLFVTLSWLPFTWSRSSIPLRRGFRLFRATCRRTALETPRTTRLRASPNLMRLIRPDWDSLGLAWTASASIRLRRKKRGGGAIDCDDFLHPSRRAPTQTEASHCSRRARHAPAHSSSRLHSVVAWWMHSRSQVIDFRADVLHVYVNIWAWESPAKSSPSTERPDFLRSNRDAGLLGSSIVCKSLQVKTFSTVWNSVPQINSRFRRNKRRRGNKYKRSFHWMNEYRNEHVREGIQSTFFICKEKSKRNYDQYHVISFAMANELHWIDRGEQIAYVKAQKNQWNAIFRRNLTEVKTFRFLL